MWATLPPPPNPPPPPHTAVSRRRTYRTSASSREVRSSVAKTTANPGSNPQQGQKKVNNQKQKEEEERGNGISGSDILRALQRASARKAQITTNKKMQQQLQRTTPGRRSEDANRVVDYDKVRPVTVKSDWATRLDELDKRLQQFLSI